MIITNVRKKCPVEKGFCFSCLKGCGEYNLIHFFDPVTVLLDEENVTTKGDAILIYGVGIGLLTVLIRVFGAYPEGMSFAILIMNGFTPLINRYCKPQRF